MKRILIIGIFTSLSSCGLEDKRIELIKEKSGIELPSEYEVTRNESIDAGSIDGDFSVYIEMKFDEENFKSLQGNIRTNIGLGVWINYESGLHFTSSDDKEPTTIEIDTIKKTLKFEMHHI